MSTMYTTSQADMAGSTLVRCFEFLATNQKLVIKSLGPTKPKVGLCFGTAPPHLRLPVARRAALRTSLGESYESFEVPDRFPSSERSSAAAAAFSEALRWQQAETRCPRTTTGVSGAVGAGPRQSPPSKPGGQGDTTPAHLGWKVRARQVRTRPAGAGMLRRTLRLPGTPGPAALRWRCRYSPV